MIDWFIDLHLALGPLSPHAPRPWFNGPFVPHIETWEPSNLTKFQMAPKPKLLISSGSKKKEPKN